MSLDIKLTSLRVIQGPTDQDVTVTMKPKYTDERRYTLPRECLAELQMDLERLGFNPKSEPAETSVAKNQINVRAPKKWLVGSGLPKYPVVFVVFDPQSEGQAGYALAADAALKMATELTKQAEILRANAKPRAN